VRIVQQIQQLEESWSVLFKEHPVLGDAYCSTVGLLETGNSRLFIKVKYRFPEDREDRYQTFYLSSGTNTGNQGSQVFFPCDGTVIQSANGVVSPWIAKVTYTMSVYNYKKKDNEARFGTPYFAILSYCMRYKQVSSNWWKHPRNLDTLLKKMLGKHSIDLSSLVPTVLPLQLIRIGKSIGNRDSLINRFIGMAISYNYLRDLPSTVSKYQDEYPSRSRYTLDYREILQELKYPLKHNGKIIDHHILDIVMEDGTQYVPVEALSLDLEKQGYLFLQLYNTYQIYRKSLQSLHQANKEFQRQMLAMFPVSESDKSSPKKTERTNKTSVRITLPPPAPVTITKPPTPTPTPKSVSKSKFKPPSKPQPTLTSKSKHTPGIPTPTPTPTRKRKRNISLQEEKERGPYSPPRTRARTRMATGSLPPR